MRFFSTTLLALTLVASNVAAHGVITEIQGANGVKGVGFGVTDLTGKKLRLFNQASRYVTGDKSICGSQKLDGKKQTEIDFASALKTATNPKNLATADADGLISMTLFQVNADGAGPYTCKVSADASGKDFKDMEVVTQVPGTKGKSNAANKAFKFAIKLPADTRCTGPNNACLVQCKSALNQPFGGCLAIGQSGAGQANKVSNGQAVAKAPKALVVSKRELNRQVVEEVVARDVFAPETEEEDHEVAHHDVEADVDTTAVVARRAISRLFNVRAMQAARDIPTTA